MIKVNLNNGNETKSNIFSWDIFKFDTVSIFMKKYQNMSMTSKIEISQFMTKVNLDNVNETK